MMTTHTDKTDSWEKPNSDKFDFNEHAREIERADEFSQLDRRGLGLRPFIERETQTRAASSGGGSETLVRGKMFLRQLPSGEFELSVFRGRNSYDTYYSYDRDELVWFAQSLMEGSN